MARKVLFIGDIHGNTDWISMAQNALTYMYDIVFLGDYVDSYHIKPHKQVDNLKRLCAFLEKYKHKNVTALLGNHDFAYIHHLSNISGYNSEYAHTYREIFEQHRDIFKIAWEYTNPDTKEYTLATHAGLTSRYWNKHVAPELKEGGVIHKIVGDTSISIATALNYMIDKEVIWQVGPVRGGYQEPGPLWADFTEIIKDPYPSINQVHGHTPQIAPTLTHIKNNFIANVDIFNNTYTGGLILTL